MEHIFVKFYTNVIIVFAPAGPAHVTFLNNHSLSAIKEATFYKIMRKQLGKCRPATVSKKSIIPNFQICVTVYKNRSAPHRTNLR